MATYVASPISRTGATNKSGLFGSVLAFFAVGCPSHNKRVLLATPSMGLLAWAVLRRISQENAWEIPATI